MNWPLLLLVKYKYVVLFPLAAFEGPVVSLAVGFLIRTGVLRFWPAYGILLFGDIVPDSIFYSIGYFGKQTSLAQKYFAKSNFFSNHFDLVEKLWREHGRKTMFFGKLAYGMALPFLISAGMTRMPYKRFISYAIPITLFQYGVIMGIGYASGSFYASVGKYIDWVYFGMAGIVVLAVTGYILATRYARKKVLAMEQEALTESAKIT